MDVQIPGYTVIRPIGQGGMAIVYLAYQHNLERQVALKILTPALAANPDFCERFMREAKIGASLCHRNIVPVFDVGHFQLHQYLAMEYLPSGDLNRRLAAGCDAGAVLRIIYDVACALHYAHSKSFIHRDIKPENILFREDQTAVLTDFGIAVDVKSAAAAATRDRQIVGSPRYMSPEQARADSLDIRSDIYSLGAVLYEALARRPLLESGATVADVVRHSAEPVPRLPSEVSWLQPILERMLARNRDERFADMDEVMRALEPCLKVPASLLGVPRPRDAEAAQVGQPAPVQRASRADATRTEAPRLAPSAPTLIQDLGEDLDLELELALASCPPPAMAQVPPQRHRSLTGILLFLLALSALPFAFLHGPALLDNVRQLANQPVAATLPTDYRAPEDRIPPPASAESAEISALSVAVDETPASLAAMAAPESASQSADEAATATTNTATTDLSLPATPPDVVAAANPEPAPAPDPVEQLLQQADDALQTSHLTVPDVSSAYEKYLEVLSLDPRNKPAREGLAIVASRYLELASKALNEDKLERAQEYVDLASSIATRHRLRDQITQRIGDLQHVLNRIRNLSGQRRPESWS